jgi:hypothetical protein
MDHWFWREVARLRARAIKVAFFLSVDKAAEAVNELIKFYARRLPVAEK